MHQAKVQGLDVGELIAQAMSRYSDTDKHRALTMRLLLRNHKRTEILGCCTFENLLKLRSGKSATITAGRHAGYQLEVDHIVPKSLIPALAKDFANLSFQPYRINRTKSDQVGHAQLRAVKIFARNGLVPTTTVERVKALVEHGLSVRAARLVLPGTVAHLSAVPSSLGFATGAADPRVIIASAGQLTERIADWEPRADSALSTADLIQRQTAEHLTRMQALLSQAQARAEEDVNAARRLEAELANMRSLCENNMSRVVECIDNAGTACNHAREVLGRWQHQLSLAEEWLINAKKREQQAEHEVKSARNALSHAEDELRDAESELESAKERTEPAGKDRDGKTIYEPIDTTSYERAVDEAQREVDRCEEEVERAVEELEQAEAEREAAEARVNVCTQAVTVAHEAGAAAGNALESASCAKATAERAMEENARATHLAEQAGQTARRAQAAVAVFAKHTSAATTFEADAATNLQAAQNHHSSSRQRSTLGSMEMSWRVEQLRAFDRPINEF